MGKILILVPILLAIPWVFRTLWQMRKARGPKERAFVARTSITAWMLIAFAAVVLSVLKGQAMIFSLPVIVVSGLAFQHASRKARARIQLEESDPLSRARPLN